MSFKPVTGLTQFANIGGDEPASVLDANFTAITNAQNDCTTYTNYAADTGAINAYVVNFPAGITLNLDVGVEVEWTPANTNNAASTLNAGGTGANPLVNQSGTALTGGELIAGRLVKSAWDGANWQLTASPIPQAANTLPAGEVQLQFITATQLKAVPWNGNKVMVNGALMSVPSGGLSIANTNIHINGTAGQSLAASTLYYLYVWNSGGNFTEDFSTTAYATDATTGMTIKSGDATRTLVGMIATNSSSQFSAILTRSWFNDQGVVSAGHLSTNRTTASGSYVEINSEIRASFLAWTGEIVTAIATGEQIAPVGGAVYSSIGFNGTTAEDIFNSTTSNIGNPLSMTFPKSGLTEGLNYATLLARTQGGVTGTWTGAASAPERCTLRVICNR